MPVLLLARGDDDARELLKQAIKARYGPRPPAFDALKMQFNGRVHTRLGPIKTWVPLDVTAQFNLPNQFRWDFTAKPAGVPVRKGTESYDGQHLRTATGVGGATTNEDQAVIVSFQHRLWAMAALLLTPLGDHFVHLEHKGELLFSATNTQLGATVNVQLAPETYWVDQVYVDCVNPDQQRQQRYRLCPATTLTAFDDLLMPSKISGFWDDDPLFEMQPTRAESDPEIPSSIFSIQHPTESA
jgi:hypothetical protein